MSGITSFCLPPKPLPDSDIKPVLIRLADVRIERGHRMILSGVNLSIHRNDFVAITGPNGGGKTTLIRLILGLVKPSGGSVEVLQKGIKISYLPQKNNVDSHYPVTVREVIASGLSHQKPDSCDRVGEMLDLVELSNHADKPIGALSGGQLQRTLLARAIISRPELLVLDEPLSYIDKHFEQKMYDIIGKMAMNTTIILVSHEITTIAAMANRHLIVDGSITECQSARHFARIALCES